MAVTNGYCNLRQLRDHLGDTGEKLPTTLLERAINAASREIDKLCGRRFWQDDTVQVRLYRPGQVDTVWVDDISTSSGLIVKTDTSNDGTYATTWATTDYELQPLNAASDGQIRPYTRIAAVDRYQFSLTGKAAPLQITAKWGWPAIPEEIEEACLLEAAALYKRNEAVFGIAGSNDVGVMRIGRRDPHVSALLYGFMKFDARAV